MHHFICLRTVYVTPAGKFFWFLLFMLETLLYFTYYGVLCVAITPNLLAAAVASNSLYLTINLFSGFIIPRPVRLFCLQPLCFMFVHKIMHCYSVCT